MKYNDLNDFELVDFVNDNNEQALDIVYKKYKPLIVKIATKLVKYCPNTGTEIDDLIQEGMLGLSMAINGFNNVCDTTFFTYAYTCINNKMLSYIVSTRRLKHKALNNSIYINSFADEGMIDTLLCDNSNNPEAMLIDEENETELFSMLTDVLSDVEKKIVMLKINGFSYDEISDMIDKPNKTIINMMVRIRKKIKNKLMEN